MKYLGMKSALAKLAGAVVLGVMLAPTAQAQVTVAVLPGVTPQMNAGAVLSLTASITGDPLNEGVTWTLRGSGSHGTLSNITTTSVTYTAPATVTSSYTVTLNAKSIYSPSVVTAVTITLNPQVAKAPLAGLVAMGDVSYTHQGGWPNNNLSEIEAFPHVFSGAVINVEWSQLEPTQGVFDFSAIDGTGNYYGTGLNAQGLAALAYYNQTYHTNIGAELRIHNDGTLTLPGEPAWALAIGGGPGGTLGIPGGVQIDNGTNVVGAYWSTTYDAAWEVLQKELAAYYDANPSFAEVTVESCSSEDAEPMHMATDITSLTNERSLLPSGDTDLDTPLIACFQNAQTDYEVWKNTAVDFGLGLAFISTDSCTPAHPTNCTSQEPTITTNIMTNLRSAFGGRAVWGNQGETDPYPTNQASIYSLYQTAGGPIEFQSGSTNAPYTDPTGLTGLCQLINYGAGTYNMTDMEIHQDKNVGGGGAEPLDLAQLQALAAQIGPPFVASACTSIP